MSLQRFSELAPGTSFKYQGRAYCKLGMNLAQDSSGHQTMFGSDMLVEIPQEGAEPSAECEHSK